MGQDRSLFTINLSTWEDSLDSGLIPESEELSAEATRAFELRPAPAFDELPALDCRRAFCKALSFFLLCCSSSRAFFNLLISLWASSFASCGFSTPSSSSDASRTDWKSISPRRSSTSFWKREDCELPSCEDDIWGGKQQLRLRVAGYEVAEEGRMEGRCLVASIRFIRGRCSLAEGGNSKGREGCGSVERSVSCGGEQRCLDVSCPRCLVVMWTAGSRKSRFGVPSAEFAYINFGLPKSISLSF